MVFRDGVSRGDEIAEELLVENTPRVAMEGTESVLQRGLPSSIVGDLIGDRWVEQDRERQVRLHFRLR